VAYGVTFGAGNYGLGNALAVAMFLVLVLGAVAFFLAFRPSQDARMTMD
jgi:ABC-type sugar transport system permease subunit